MIFSAFSSVTRGDSAQMPLAVVTPSARPSCRPPDSGAPTAPCAHGSVPTQPAKDFGTRCHTWIAPSRPEGLPIPATTPFCPSKAASADGENGTNRSLRSRSRPFRCSKCKQTVERRSDPASGGRSGLVETVKVGSYGTLKSPVVVLVVTIHTIQ